MQQGYVPMLMPTCELVTVQYSSHLPLGVSRRDLLLKLEA